MKFFWGVVVPALIMLLSFILTFWLYRRFSRDDSDPRE
jgi:uncharacterized membrane protein YdjX (TVP38/TMEM64 family)